MCGAVDSGVGRGETTTASGGVVGVGWVGCIAGDGDRDT